MGADGSLPRGRYLAGTRINVAVNLSAVQFRGGNIVMVARDALEASGLVADRLELEITESVLLRNTQTTLDTLHQLRALGLRISMDDFGIGYSSLNYLRWFPFDKIKIDRCFVGELARGATDRMRSCARSWSWVRPWG